MKVLLVYPPRRIWPFINEGDNYLLPQSLVCLGAYLRERGLDVKIIDCMPLKLGWKSLSNLIREEKPDVVGVGESHAVYIDEALKLIKLVKEINPKIITVGGGGHFTNLAEEIMSSFPYLDFIVRGEGERSFYELLEAISLRKGFDKVKGLR
jgi:anaerobic magnesium-protoporphyrin IX monomethyl ester cyclase